MQKFQDVVLDSQGRPVAGAVIAVQEYPGGGAATVYETDAVGAAYTPTTDAFGAFFFYAPNGNYSYTVTVGGVLRKTVTDVTLYDPSEENEGTFTFSDASGGTPVAGSSGSGYWVKQGTMVYVSGRWKWNSNGQTVAAVLDGLPFAGRSGLFSQCLEVASQGNTSYDGSHSRLFARIGVNETKLYFAWSDIPAGTVQIGNLDIAQIHICGWYRTN
jgi:hypothetical protein